jgi:alpha-ribazole phosphatase
LNELVLTSPKSELVLLRHAQPIVANGVCYGATDVAADDALTEQAARDFLAAWAANGKPLTRRVLCSPRQRCVQLARAIVAMCPALSFEIDPRLAEFDFGHWEMHPWSDIPVTALDAWTADFAQHRFGGQDSVAALMARVQVAFYEALPNTPSAAPEAKHAGDRPANASTLWITHAGVMRAVQCITSGVGVPAQASQWPVQAPGFGEWVLHNLGGFGRF